MLTKRHTLIITVLLLFTLAATGCGLLVDPAAPSGELVATPVLVATEAPADSEAMPAAEDGAYPAAEEVAAPVTEDEAYPAAEEMAAPVVAEEAYPAAENEAAPVTGGVTVYAIDSSASTVRFELNEELRGQPVTVVGTTDQIAGEIAVDLADLSTATAGPMQINARGLATDNNFRNRAIQNEILDTGGYEFITFTPMAVNGLSGSAAPGDTFEFTIDGDLTIRDITQPVTFAVSATAVSDSQITGTATAVVQRADYNLLIPSVPNVANVEEEVELYIDFVANAT
ncbi:MAG: YceI family protein [Candidatus Promineifilaceae bacterium]